VAGPDQDEEKQDFDFKDGMDGAGAEDWLSFGAAHS